MPTPTANYKRNTCLWSLCVLVMTLFMTLLPAKVEAQFNLLFTSDTEIPNSLVNCIIEDKDGMI